MCPLLRRPNAVPSLFSQGSEEDDGTPRSDRPSGRFAGRLEHLAVAMGLDNEETILGRGGRALAGTSIAVFVVGLPLMKITSIVMGIALAR